MLLARYKKVTALLVAFSAIYLVQAVWTQPDKATLIKYHITAGQEVALVLTIAIPYIVIWVIAVVGYLRVRSYAESIGDSKDGLAFAGIARGLAWLAFWLPVSAVLASFTTDFYTAHPASTVAMIRLTDYLNLLILLPAFLITYTGTRKLLPLIKKSTISLPLRLMVAYICFAVLYTFLVFHDPARQLPTKSTTVAAYYLPDWLIVTTFVIPRLIMWFMGVQAVYTMYLYRHKVKGTLYKSALNNLARGVGGMVVGSIVLRCAQSLSSPLSGLGLAWLLLIIYALLVILSIGYVLIAKGAGSLQQLEEL